MLEDSVVVCMEVELNEAVRKSRRNRASHSWSRELPLAGCAQMTSVFAEGSSVIRIGVGVAWNERVQWGIKLG